MLHLRESPIRLIGKSDSISDLLRNKKEFLNFQLWANTFSVIEYFQVLDIIHETYQGLVNDHGVDDKGTLFYETTKKISNSEQENYFFQRTHPAHRL